jgi:hypothetical protein
MAPLVRSHQKHVVQALCPFQVSVCCKPMSSHSGRLSLRSLPKMNFLFPLLTRRRMDPAGFEPASATWTESYVPITPRALGASIRMTLNAGKGVSHTSGKPVPNWEAAHRSIGQQALAPTLMTKIDDYPPASRRTGRSSQSPVRSSDVDLSLAACDCHRAGRSPSSRWGSSADTQSANEAVR